MTTTASRPSRVAERVPRLRGWLPTRAAAVASWVDHAIIFVLIAGSCTPFALIMPTGVPRVMLLVVARCGAAIGILSRLFWTHAPR